jgi:hypothetical protein
MDCETVKYGDVDPCNEPPLPPGNHTELTKKQWLGLAGWIFAGIVLGEFAETVLFRFWLDDVFSPLVRHFDSSNGSVTWQWLAVWINIPGWVTAAVAGVLGGLFTKSPPALALTLFGVCFAFTPLVLYAYFYSEMPSLENISQHAVSIPLAVFCGLSARRIRCRKAHSAGLS